METQSLDRKRGFVTCFLNEGWYFSVFVWLFLLLYLITHEDIVFGCIGAYTYTSRSREKKAINWALVSWDKIATSSQPTLPTISWPCLRHCFNLNLLLMLFDIKLKTPSGTPNQPYAANSAKYFRLNLLQPPPMCCLLIKARTNITNSPGYFFLL